MSKAKAKSKKGKKIEPKDTIPMKTVFDILLDQYKDPQSLTLAQQKYVIKVLGLEDNSLYDSISIDIITDCVRYCMNIKLQTKYIEIIYRILQNALYKIKNDLDFDQQQFKNYLDQQLSLKLTAIKAAESENEDPNKSNNKIDQIATNFESIRAFIEDRIINQYTVYRAALFKNNPSNIQYEKFKKRFEVGDVVQFHNGEHLSQIKELKDNHVVLQLLDKENKQEFIVSKDQTKFLRFVSKEVPESDTDSQPKEEETEAVDTGKMDEDNSESADKKDKKADDSVNCVDNEKEKVDEMDNEKVLEMDDEIKLINKTLIDLIVEERIEKALRSMQNKIDSYKHEIAKLKSCKSNSNLKPELSDSELTSNDLN